MSRPTNTEPLRVPLPSLSNKELLACSASVFISSQGFSWYGDFLVVKFSTGSFSLLWIVDFAMLCNNDDD